MFAALIERRGYKSIMSCRAAYSGLLKMGARLDPDLEREFQFVAGLQVGQRPGAMSPPSQQRRMVPAVAHQIAEKRVLRHAAGKAFRCRRAADCDGL